VSSSPNQRRQHRNTWSSTGPYQRGTSQSLKTMLTCNLQHHEHHLVIMEHHLCMDWIVYI
jgi:hypothetical protein